MTRPASESSPRRPVIAAVDDIIFVSKIRGTAEHLGVDVRVVRTLPSALDAARALQGALIIVDLQARQFDPLALARAVKAEPDLAASELLGFFSHVQTALMQQARDAGFDRVLPRSAFTSKLAAILEDKP